MDFSTLHEIIHSEVHETEEWDFKRGWHKNKASVFDILAIEIPPKLLRNSL